MLSSPPFVFALSTKALQTLWGPLEMLPLNIDSISLSLTILVRPSEQRMIQSFISVSQRYNSGSTNSGVPK